MIVRYRFGQPIETDAVLNKPAAETDEVRRFTVHRPGEPLEHAADRASEVDNPGTIGSDTFDARNLQNPLFFTYTMDPDDIVYGLGEQVRGINKRNFTYVSRCVDGALHTEDRHSLYSAHNFFIVSGSETFGAFFDTAGIISFDMGETDIDRIQVTLEYPDCDLYLIEGEDPTDIVRQFRALVGRSYIPPKWAFGYQQSRWAYKTEDDFRDIARRYREAGIPSMPSTWTSTTWSATRASPSTASVSPL